jgi:sugar/nucleoside kinase (ribokinase family)
MTGIVTIGEIVVEIMAVRRGQSFLAPGDYVGPFPSGAPAIFIDQVARLGQPCGIVSAVGDDDFGRLNVRRLQADGVDVSAVTVDPDRPTGHAIVRYREDGERDFIFNIKHSACHGIALGAAARALVARSGHLHVMGSSLFSPSVTDAVVEAARLVKDGGGTVSFDPNVRKEMLALPGMRDALGTILSLCDLFLPSGPEITLLTQAADEECAYREVLGRGVRAIVVKHGDRGARYADARGVVDSPAFSVDEVDPTGAGDCFCAAFVVAWLNGRPIGEALTDANAAGARTVTLRGPMEGASTRAELDAFVATTPRRAA